MEKATGYHSIIFPKNHENSQIIFKKMKSVESYDHVNPIFTYLLAWIKPTFFLYWENQQVVYIS